MSRWFRSFSTRRASPRRQVEGAAGLVIALHGYGSDERQLDTLLPLRLPVVTVSPRAPHRVDPGFGWWRPETTAGTTELAPPAGVDAAVDAIVELVERERASSGFEREQTVLLGYSQGAMLSLTVAARRPDLVGAVAAGAGFLLPNEVVGGAERLAVALSNGSLDSFVTRADHEGTLARFEAAGHTAIGWRDDVPHVIDRAQVPRFEAFVASALGVAAGKG